LNSLQGRLLAGAGASCLIVLVIAGAVLSTLFDRAVSESLDDRLRADMDNLLATLESSERGTARQVRPLGDPRFERAFSGWYWEVGGPGSSALSSRSLWDQHLWGSIPVTVADTGLERTYDAAGPDGSPIRILEREVRLPGSPVSQTVRIAGATASQRAAGARVRRALIISFAVLAAGILVTLLAQVRWGLAPLARTGRALAAIRAGEQDRLRGRFPEEIRPLAKELNGLLAQNERIIERARTQTGNLAHALKTPLSILNNTCTTLPAPVRDEVERQLQAMRTQVDRHLARARVAGPASSRPARGPPVVLAELIGDLHRTMDKIQRARAPEAPTAFRVDCEADVAFAGDRQDLLEVLGNVLENAYQWSRSQVTVRVRKAAGGLFVVEISDDGPGLPAEGRREVLERGKRLDESVSGSGLGLAIARDIIELYGGRILLGDAAGGGLQVSIVLPATGDLR